MDKFKICVLVFLLIGLINSVSGDVAVSIDTDKSEYYLGEIVQFTIRVNISNPLITCELTSANLTIQDGNSIVCDLPAIYGYYENYGNCNLYVNVSETNHDYCVGYGGTNNTYTYKINWVIPSNWSNDSYAAEMEIIFEGNEYSNTTTFNISMATLNYTLYKKINFTGQNLICLPLLPSPPITTAEDLCQSIPNSETITQWNPITQCYKAGHVCGTSLGNFNLAAFSGYFVSVSATTNWTLNGSILPQGYIIYLVKIPGSTGANLICPPYNSIISPFTAEGLCESTPNLEIVTSWDPINQLYKGGYSCVTKMVNFNLSKGIGYSISVSANTTWTPI